jgi:integrase
VVTYEEYHAALEALLADPQADERTRSLQAWVLLVTYRFGLRISEALGLRRKDLWPDAELPVVLVRPNAYRELKSDAGQRVVPLIGTLSPLERRVIDEWITYIDANFAEDHEVALTGTRDDARRMVETEALRRRLRDALHAASGDASVRLHHLRHAFAMRLQLVMTVEHLPTDRRFEQALLRILGPTDLEATRELLLDSRVLSHRGLSAARVLVGHASVGVYRRSYAHLDDLVSAAWLQPVFDARCFEVGDQLLSYLLAKPLKQPTKKAARSCLSLSLLEGFCDPPLATPDAMVCARRGPIVLPAGEPQVEVPLRLRDIDRVLDIVHRRRGIDGLGALTMWPATQLSRLLATEHAVREASRYDIEASGWPATTATDSVSHVRAGRRMLHETRRVTPLLAQMEAYLESNEFVRRSQSTCDLWRRYYRPDATPWVLPTLENVATAASWCLAIGVKHNQIAVRVPPDVDASISEEARSTCGLLGIARQPCAEKVLPRVRRASSAAASSSPVRFGFVILENDRGPVMRMTHLNRAMHVLTTWLSLRAGPAPITTQPKEAKS